MRWSVQTAAQSEQLRDCWSVRHHGKMTTVVPNLSARRRALGHWLFRSGTHLSKARAFAYGEARRYAPTVRPGLTLVMGAVIALVLVGLATFLCWRQMSGDLSARLTSSDRALAVVLNEIDRDLKGLQIHLSDAQIAQCPERLRESLTRSGIESLLVREFFVAAANDLDACGSFGLITPYWDASAVKATAEARLHVIPAQSIRPTVVVVREGSNFSLAAVIEPRQILDRLPQGSPEQRLQLLTSSGAVLATQGSRLQDSREFVAQTHRIQDWPLKIQASIGHYALLDALRGQLPFWSLTWVLSLALCMSIGNGLARRHSSRAIRLQRALRKRRFAPVVQPIVDTQTGHCLGAEVLMRWKHPARGLVPPAEFIDYAERSGLIVPMSDLLMRQAHRQLTEIALSHPHLYFSFNITPAQLRTQGFAQSLLDIFDGEPLGPGRVVLELTERELVDDQVRDEMTRLRARGFRIAIDDFGTGQSSLAVLQDLPIDRLKIDRAFVNTISSEQHDQPVLDAIIALAHRLGIAMIAEGIETEQQQRYLHTKGVQALQGYRLARPMIPTDFDTWLGASALGSHSDASDAPTFNPLTIDLALVMDALEPAREVLIKQRRHHLRMYRNCLLGNELLDWLSARFECSRTAALRLGQRMVARGLLVHVQEEHDLTDAPLFYRLVPHEAIAETLRPAPSATGNAQQWLAWIQGPHGVRPGVRFSGLWRYRNVVSGSEIVEALMRAGGLTRDVAVGVGVQLMRSGHLRHAFDERGFIDSAAQQYHFAR